MGKGEGRKVVADRGNNMNRELELKGSKELRDSELLNVQSQ